MPKARTTRAKRASAPPPETPDLGSGSNGSVEHRYRATVRRFLDAVTSVVPSGATVLVVPARVISREVTSAYLKYPIMPVNPDATRDSKPASPAPASTSGVS